MRLREENRYDKLGLTQEEKTLLVRFSHIVLCPSHWEIGYLAGRRHESVLYRKFQARCFALTTVPSYLFLHLYKSDIMQA